MRRASSLARICCILRPFGIQGVPEVMYSFLTADLSESDFSRTKIEIQRPSLSCTSYFSVSRIMYFDNYVPTNLDFVAVYMKLDGGQVSHFSKFKV